MRASADQSAGTRRNLRRLVSTSSAPILALSVLVYLGLVFAFHPFVIDDTYITFRYADNFAEGGAISFNPDDTDPVEGYTSFLWMAVSAASIRLHIDPLLTVRVLSVSSGVATLFVLWFLARITIGPGILAAIPSLMLAVSSEFAEWSIAGLETVFFLLLLLLSLYRLLVELREDRFPFSALTFALLALTRPEGVAFFMVALTFLVVLKARIPAKIRWSYRRIALFAGLFCFVYGPYFLWRFTYYGYLFSNSFYAKQMENGGAQYIREFLLYLGPLVIFAILAFYPRLGGRCKSRDGAWIPFFWALILVNFAGLWNVWPAMAWAWRLLLHLLPLFFILVLVFIRHLVESGRRRSRIVGVLVVLLLTGWCAHPHLLPQRLREAHAVADGLDQCHKPIARWLQAVMVPGSTIAIVDTGVIPYFSGLRSIDIANIPLNNEKVAHGGYTSSDFWGENPRAFVVRGNEEGTLQEHPGRIPLLQKAVDDGFVPIRNALYRGGYVLYVYADLRFVHRPSSVDSE